MTQSLTPGFAAGGRGFLLSGSSKYFTLLLKNISNHVQKKKRKIYKKKIQTQVDFLNQTKSLTKNAQDEKSRDFCLTFMNSMENNRRNRGPRPWIF
jgi:hypothetical protein